MTNVYKYNLSEGSFDYHDPEGGLSHVLQITPTNLVYKLTKSDDTAVIHFNLSLETFRNNHRICDQSWFGFATSALIADGSEFDSSNIVSLLDFSGLNKNPSIVRGGSDSTDLSSRTGAYPIRIFVPFAGADFSQMTITLGYPQNGDVSFDVTGGNFIDQLMPWKNLFSDITLSSSTEGNVINVQVTTEDTNISNVYVEPVIGIVNKTKVALTNGVGSFKVITDSLDSGDEVEVKVGYKLYSNHVTFTKTI